MTESIKNLTPVKPFLKWAGGKRQLLEQINKYLPNELASGSIKRYIEPFIGGGAVLLHIAQLYKIDDFFISDINAELVLAYKTIQINVEDLITLLLGIQEKYLSLNEEKRNEYYYYTRQQFNAQREQTDFQNYDKSWIERTAQIVFLNRTCFNGLFRVNSKGDFNVPMGRYKKPNICEPKNLRAVSKILQRTQIHCGDFTECEEVVNEQSLVYFDPPYRPISKTANFTSYSEQTFDDSEQLRLRDFFKLLDKKKGAKLILSNSDPKNEEETDNFFEVAYEGYRIEQVKATRNINSNSSKRGYINELLIMNY
jgi:DNA adenine methylase